MATTKSIAPSTDPTLTDFQKGAIYVLDILKAEVEARMKTIRRLQHDPVEPVAGLGVVFNGVDNVLFGLQVDVESRLIKTRWAQACPVPPRIPPVI